MIKQLVNRYIWWSYKSRLRQRWNAWDRAGGGRHAAQEIKPFRLLERPSAVPIALDDPIFQASDYQYDLPFQKQRVYREYVYHLRQPCYIEPEFGYTIMEPAVLIPESLVWSNFARTDDLLRFFSGVPSIKDYREAKQGNKNVRREQIVVSLRHIFDSNYGHCLIQLMTALCLLDECGVSPEIPIVVSARLGRLPFFQEMIQRGELCRRRWIVQEEAYLRAEEVIFAAAEWPTRSMLNRFLDAIEVPPGASETARRLFILRRSRQISNLDAILPALNEFGFEPIRPEEFTLAQQIALFSETAIVCGAVGAALTNIIFRREAPAKILEVRAGTETDTFFYGLARTCGYSYSYFMGNPYETADRYSNFTVKPDRFRAFLEDAV